MTNPNICPECGSHDTRREHVEWYTREIEEVRVCNACPTMYTATYTHPIVEVESTDA